MGFYYITFRSVTHAQRGERMLSRQNLRVSLMRTPRWMEEQGCGYAVKVWTNDIAAVVHLLREGKVQLRRVYSPRQDGGMEEVNL